MRAFTKLKIGTKITVVVSCILIVLLLVSVGIFIYLEFAYLKKSTQHKAGETLAMVETIHTQAMLHRASVNDDNPVIQSLDGVLNQFSESSPHTLIWLTMGEKVRAYQQAKGQKIEPPRDDIDQEAIATGREISRYIGGNILRVSRPVILGKGTAANPKCYACHQDKMGINEGEVIGTYSMHYDAKEESETFSFFAWGTIFMAFAVSVVIGWINAFFIKKLAGAPIYQMTEIMNHMAKGNTSISIPSSGRYDEIGDMERALIVFRDNSIRRHQAKNDLQAAKETAENANKAKTFFLANMSHELRTPLNAIIGFSEMMVMEVMGPIKNNDYADYSKTIHSSATHLLNMINNILDLSRIEAGKETLHEEIINTEDLLNTCLLLLKNIATENSLRLDGPNHFDIYQIKGDEQKLRQVLINLLSNAIKFTPAGGVVSVQAYMGDGGDGIIEVSDTGIGISSENHGIIFGEFEQVGNEMNESIKGTGLGLPLSLRLMEMHGGTLELESTPGRGTKVKIIIPVWRMVNTKEEYLSASQ